ncbi:MAG: heme o synthase [Gammaproteobacteria bacterium]
MKDYLELCKPKVVLLMLLTAVVGMFLATPYFPPLNALIFGNIGIAFVAGAAAVANHLADQRIDAIMHRTRKRPLPSGRVTPKQAGIFALILGLVGTVILILWVNTLTAILSVLTLIGYAGVYTLYLKRATPQNIVIGGAAGAAPPLLGWTAVTGQIDPNALLLVLIIFVWTPPHFWALAIYRYNEYAKAGIPMLPVTHGILFTKLSIVLYTILLLAVSTLPFAFGMSGMIYVIGAIILGGIFLYWAIRLKYTSDPLVALKTFRYSIVYLMLLFVILVIDHYL